MRETANRILVGELYAVLDGQVDADDPGDEIVRPVEFLALALVEREEVAASEALDRGCERKVCLPPAAGEKIAKLVVTVDLRPLRERQIGLLFSSAVIGRMLRCDAPSFSLRNLRICLGTGRGWSFGNRLIAVAVKPDGRDDRQAQKRKHECADGCRKTPKETAQ